MYCSKCGAKINEGELYCSKCGAPVEKCEEEVIDAQVVTKTDSNINSNSSNNESTLPMDSFAIPGFVLSLCGLALFGLIFSSISYSRIQKGLSRGRGFALAGVIISSVSLLFVILYIIFAFALFNIGGGF